LKISEPLTQVHSPGAEVGAGAGSGFEVGAGEAPIGPRPSKPVKVSETIAGIKKTEDLIPFLIQNMLLRYRDPDD